MNKALILGGAGFVGRHLVQRLLDRGVHVTIIDDLSTGLPPMQWLPVPEPPMTFLQMEVRTYFRSRFIFDFDAVFHCAAVVGGRMMIDGDPLRVATDLSIDAEFFNWIVRCKPRPKKVVYFSSSAVYPIVLQREGQHCKLSEGLIDFHHARMGMPDQTYGMAKFVGEYLAYKAVKDYDLDVVCYRPFSGYGEDQSLDYPFPSIVKRVLDKENPVTVWGSGKQLRDFIYIDDAVDAVLATMDLLKPGDALNLGSGTGITFTTLAKKIASQLGRHIDVKNDPNKPEGVFARVADVWKLQQFASVYQPQVTLEEGIKRTIQELQQSSMDQFGLRG